MPLAFDCSDFRQHLELILLLVSSEVCKGLYRIVCGEPTAALNMLKDVLLNKIRLILEIASDNDEVPKLFEPVLFAGHPNPFLASLRCSHLFALSQFHLLDNNR